MTDKKQTPRVEVMDLKELIPYSKNPRKNDKAVEVVKKSIEKYGYKSPIVIDRNKVIINGHTRYEALKQLNYEKALILWADDLTEEEAKAFRIMDNKSAEYAKWIPDLLKEEIQDLLTFEFDPKLTGFSEAEIDRILNPKEAQIKGNIAPKYKIQPGELWQLGRHRLICGDSTKEETYLKLIQKGTDIHMVYTDPPYGVSYSGTNNPNGRDWRVIEGDDLRGDALYDMLYGCFSNINQHLVKNGALYVFHASSNQIIFEKALNAAGFQVKQQLIWAKHHILGHSHYHWCHEPIFYVSRMNENPIFYGTRANKTTLNKINPDEMDESELRAFVKEIQKDSTIWEVKKDNTKDYIHPTQKPVRMAEKALINSSEPNQNVLEPFCGSGSTLMACENKNRTCYAVELDPEFVSHIIERWERKTGQKAVKLD